MSDDRAPDGTPAPTQPASAKGASLTDAEANRQMGHGQAPQPPSGVPEADQGPDHAATSPAHAAPASRDSETVKVGARDVVRPTEGRDEPEGGTAGEDSLADRLAKQDNTPPESGGSSGLS